MAVIYELLQLISEQYIFSVPFSSWTRSRCVDWVWAGLFIITQSVNIPTVLQLLFATWFLRSLYRLISYVLVARSLTLNNATFAHCIRFITSMCQPSWYETQSILIENWSTFCKLRKFSRICAAYWVRPLSKWVHTSYAKPRPHQQTIGYSPNAKLKFTLGQCFSRNWNGTRTTAG